MPNKKWRCEWEGDTFHFQAESGFRTSFSGPIEAVKKTLIKTLPTFARVADKEGCPELANKCREELNKLYFEYETWEESPFYAEATFMELASHAASQGVLDAYIDKVRPLSKREVLLKFVYGEDHGYDGVGG